MSDAKSCHENKQKFARTDTYMDTGKNKFKWTMSRPRPSFDPKPTLPYKFYIQYTITKNFVKIQNLRINWVRVVNMTTFDE